MGRRKDSAGRVLKDGESERKNGYQYRCTINGKRIYVYAKTLSELRKKEENISYSSETYSSNVTVDEVYKKWMNIKEKMISKVTVSNYRCIYKNHIQPTFGNVSVNNIKKSDISSFLLDLEIKSTSLVYIVFKSILDFAVADDIIAQNPCMGVYKPKTIKANRRALTIEEQEELVSVISQYHPSFSSIILFMLETGLRVGEAIALTWNDVDLDDKTITINQSLKSYMEGHTKKYEIGVPKTISSIRTIPLTENAYNILLKEEKRGEFVFLSKRGKLRKPNDIHDAIKSAIKKSDILPSHLSCHILRHTFATRLCEKNVNIKAIQKILGHSSIKTTMDIYIDSTLDFMKDEMKKL